MARRERKGGMMREILFKAKRKDNGEWVEGLPGYDINGKITEIEVYKKVFDCRIYEIDPNTLCQYTGLTDKNDKKIWENDILKAHLDESYPQDITYAKIIWSKCRFCINENHSSNIETLEKRDAEYFEVCGNIFDNPDLLEVE